MPTEFYCDGNCIPLSLFSLLGISAEVQAFLSWEVQSPPTRDYGHWAKEFGCYLQPRFEAHVTEGSMWLVHCARRLENRIVWHT